jgi:type IV pilus assembly protein PilA
MKFKKGFTLIELLAVLVLLAVIALIAMPVVLTMITSSRREAAKTAAYGYVKAVENSIASAILTNPATAMPTHVNATNISIKGTAPTAVSLNLTNGAVTSGTMTIQSFTVAFTNGIITSNT